MNEHSNVKSELDQSNKTLKQNYPQLTEKSQKHESSEPIANVGPI